MPQFAQGTENPWSALWDSFKGRSLHWISDKTKIKPMWGHSCAHLEWSEKLGVKGKKMRERERSVAALKVNRKPWWGRASLAHYSKHSQS